MALVAKTIERLKLIDHELFRDSEGKAKVAGAIDLQSIETGGNFRAPAVYVLYGLSRRVGSPDFTRPRKITWQRSVVVVVRAKAPCEDSDYTGMWATDAVEAYEHIIHAALCGWKPSNQHSALIPVNTVPGRVTGEFIEIAFTFDCQQICPVKEPSDGICIDSASIKKIGLKIGEAQMIIDPRKKEVPCEIKTNEGNTPECA